MLYQELPRIDSAPLDGWARWLGPALVAGAALSAATLLLLVGWFVLAAIVALAGFGAAALGRRFRLYTLATMVIAPIARWNRLTTRNVFDVSTAMSLERYA